MSTPSNFKLRHKPTPKIRDVQTFFTFGKNGKSSNQATQRAQDHRRNSETFNEMLARASDKASSPVLLIKSAYSGASCSRVGISLRGDLVGRAAEPANHEAVERALFLVSLLRPPVSQIPPESEPEVAVEGI